jgi:GNAT superfamily N-acetyltransferase
MQPIIRDGAATDYPAIKRIANSKHNRLSFPFIPRVVIEAAAADQAAQGLAGKNRLRVVEADGVVIAWLRAYHRNDGVTTLHEIGVAEESQSAGVGTGLIADLLAHCRQRGRTSVQLATPVDRRSNAWYPRFGFLPVGQMTGRVRTLNVYRLALASVVAVPTVGTAGATGATGAASHLVEAD